MPTFRRDVSRNEVIAQLRCHNGSDERRCSGDETIDGVRYEFVPVLDGESFEQLVIKLPDLGIVIVQGVLAVSSAACVLYSGSRTAYVAFVSFLGYWWLLSRHKLRWLVCGAAAGACIHLSL